MGKTAVEWLQESLLNTLTHQQQMQVEGLFQQAKEMEKEQLLSVYKSGLAGFMEDGIQKITITRIND